MDCERLFEMVSLFGDTKKTDMDSKQLGATMFKVIENLDGSEDFKNLLLSENANFSLSSVEFSKQHIAFKLNINDPIYKFVKFFRFYINHVKSYGNNRTVKINIDYGVYGKSGKKLCVRESNYEYEYDKTINYIKPILDSFCSDKI